MSTIVAVLMKINFSIPLIYVVFQINQGEKSLTHLLIDDKIYQWPKVNKFSYTFF